jgi:tetratricopeptide (TPR) repeat protein
MRVCLLKYFRVILIVSYAFLLPVKVWAGKPTPDPGGQAPMTTRDFGNEALYIQSDIDVYVKGPNGASLDGSAVVTLGKLTGQFYDQKTAKNGYARFNGVPPSEYIVQVVAPKYQRTAKNLDVRERSLAKITIEMIPLSDAEDAASSVGLSALTPKVQREVGRALEALRANKPNDARSNLQAAQKAAPTSPEVEYLLGVYASQINDHVQAKSYWMKTLELNPKHLSALLAVSFDLLHENRSAEAMPYLNRAVETEPSSWRAHALLAEAMILQGQRDDSVKQAERAIELGHERAASAQLILARAYASRGDQGDRDLAIKVLQAYLRSHPTDTAANKDLERLKNPQPGDSASDTASVAAGDLAALSKDASALPVPSNWLPPDVDEKVPPVEAGASCAVDDVVDKAGQRLMELVKDVDRFAATESLKHESINKFGFASSTEKRKFDYVVSIQEVQRGYLNVEEYRNSGGSPAEFPDGVATNGLPALVLIFHPYNAINFEMTCEGLARWNGGLAWQVHFKQRADKPNTIKRYRIGADGPSYPVALKGRAWISADTYQIVRLETDLVSPVPQIRLVADHTAIEYGPVKFSKGNVNMWLPQSAEVFYDWKGRRIHRRHSFSNYMLFGVEDKQKISAPKVAEAPADLAPNETPKEKP